MSAQTESEGSIPTISRPVPVLIQMLPQRQGQERRQWAVAGNIVIGREVDVDGGVRLEHDGKASKRHAQIRVLGERLQIADLQSKNHTYLNGVETTTAELKDGDVIRVGGTLLMLRFEPAQARDATADQTEILSRLLGGSVAIRRLCHELGQAARMSSPVLLVAPTGTGKELAAEAIHAQSSRCRESLVRVNCAGIVSSLTESELFGHERDAFSGARHAHKGLFQQADRGTLFLDEVGDMPSELQPKLLRALQPVQPLSAGQEGQEGQEGGRRPFLLRIRPVGAEREVEVDVRIVAATNVDLNQAVMQGRFRSDLHQRLQILTIHLPTLAERREDVLWLLHHFLNLGRAPSDWRTVTARLGELLALYAWPGNVRELMGVAQRLLMRAPADRTLDLDVLTSEELVGFQKHAQEQEAPETKAVLDESRSRQQITRELLERLLQENQGNVSKIARLLARSPRQIRRRLAAFGLLSFEDDGKSAVSDGADRPSKGKAGK